MIKGQKSNGDTFPWIVYTQRVTLAETAEESSSHFRHQRYIYLLYYYI